MPSPPRISGRLLKSLATIAKTRAGSSLVYRVTRADLRIDELSAIAPQHFGDVPLDNQPIGGRPPRLAENANLPPPAPPWSGTSATRTAAYAAGTMTPVAAVRDALAAARALATRRPSVGPMLDFCDEVALREAESSSERWRRGAPLGPLDGVPFAVKEETSVAGLRARAGSEERDGSDLRSTWSARRSLRPRLRSSENRSPPGRPRGRDARVAQGPNRR